MDPRNNLSNIPYFFPMDNNPPIVYDIPHLPVPPLSNIEQPKIPQYPSTFPNNFNHVGCYDPQYPCTPSLWREGVDPRQADNALDLINREDDYSLSYICKKGSLEHNSGTNNDANANPKAYVGSSSSDTTKKGAVYDDIPAYPVLNSFNEVRTENDTRRPNIKRPSPMPYQSPNPSSNSTDHYRKAKYQALERPSHSGNGETPYMKAVVDGRSAIGSGTGGSYLPNKNFGGKQDSNEYFSPGRESRQYEYNVEVSDEQKLQMLMLRGAFPVKELQSNLNPVPVWNGHSDSGSSSSLFGTNTTTTDNLPVEMVARPNWDLYSHVWSMYQKHTMRTKDTSTTTATKDQVLVNQGGMMNNNTKGKEPMLIPFPQQNAISVEDYSPPLVLVLPEKKKHHNEVQPPLMINTLAPPQEESGDFVDPLLWEVDDDTLSFMQQEGFQFPGDM